MAMARYALRRLLGSLVVLAVLAFIFAWARIQLIDGAIWFH